MISIAVSRFLKFPIVNNFSGIDKQHHTHSAHTPHWPKVSRYKRENLR